MLPHCDKVPGCMAEFPESRNVSQRLFLWLPVSKISLLKTSCPWSLLFFPPWVPDRTGLVPTFSTHPSWQLIPHSMAASRGHWSLPPQTRLPPTFQVDTHFQVSTTTQEPFTHMTLIKTHMQTQTPHATNTSNIIKNDGVRFSTDCKTALVQRLKEQPSRQMCMEDKTRPNKLLPCLSHRTDCMLKAGICFGTGSFAGLVSARLCVTFSEQKLGNYREVPLCPHIPAVNIHLLIFLCKTDFSLQKKLHILKKTKSCKVFISRIGKKYFLFNITVFFKYLDCLTFFPLQYSLWGFPRRW